MPLVRQLRFRKGHLTPPICYVPFLLLSGVFLTGRLFVLWFLRLGHAIGWPRWSYPNLVPGLRIACGHTRCATQHLLSSGRKTCGCSVMDFLVRRGSLKMRWRGAEGGSFPKCCLYIQWSKTGFVAVVNLHPSSPRLPHCDNRSLGCFLPLLPPSGACSLV